MSVQAILLIVALMSVGPSTAQNPIPPEPTPAWSDSASQAAAIQASINVPKRAGTLSRTEVRDLGGKGVDLVAQYVSPDEKIFGTIFIYKPTLPDSGLTFLATNEAIRRRLNATIVDDRPIAIGGVSKAGRRAIYTSDDENIGSSALIIVQAGGWMLKLRVSGPIDHSAEIAANLDALAAGLEFGKGSEPLPTHIIETEPCRGLSPSPPAELVKPAGTAAIAQTMMAIPVFVDQNGRAVAELTGRVPDRLCLAESTSDGKIPLLTFRATEPQSTEMFEPKIFQLYGDAGQIIEITRASKGAQENYALRHGIGRLIVYGGFATEPSADQLSMIRRSSDQLPVIAVVQAYGGGNTNTELFCSSFAEGCEKEK